MEIFRVGIAGDRGVNFGLALALCLPEGCVGLVCVI
jgi:hypothetical protein